MNTWEEQDYNVILQIYLLINLLNHRVNIIFQRQTLLTQKRSAMLISELKKSLKSWKNPNVGW